MQQTRRNRVTVGLMAVGLMAGTVFMAGLAQAQTTANGPYYATPSWDQTLPSATRFIILSNFASQAVLDRETGLVWEREPSSSSVIWQSARLDCAAKTTGNRKGWRLPSLHELASLVDPTQSNPALPAGHPFTNVQSAGYWSASSNADFPTGAWGVFFDNGFVLAGLKSFSFHVWCVRGGMNADQY